jgi:16S rRNA (guanine966-N2)-methyltransferase
VRVIAGERRGKRLRVPRGRRVRPTLARAKTSLFDILTSRGLVEQARVLDLFAGSGALGIEALSRGAESVVFVEQDAATAHVLMANVADSGFTGQSTVMIRSSAHAIPRLARESGTPETAEKFDGVFVDPPYGTPWADRTLRQLAAHELLADDGWVVVHHRHGEGPEPSYPPLVATVRRRIGDSVMVLYRREEPGGR